MCSKFKFSVKCFHANFCRAQRGSLHVGYTSDSHLFITYCYLSIYVIVGNLGRGFFFLTVLVTFLPEQLVDEGISVYDTSNYSNI